MYGQAQSVDCQAIETRLKPECERADVVGEQEVGSADKKPSAECRRAANSSRLEQLEHALLHRVRLRQNRDACLVQDLELG